MNPLVSFAANPGRKDRWRDEQTEREGARVRRGRLHECGRSAANGTRETCRVTDADKPPRWHTPATGR
jgi:hypothetical protein